MAEKLTKAEIKEQRKLERQQFEQEAAKAAQTDKFKKIGMWVGGSLILILAFWGLMALSSTPSSPQGELIAPKITAQDTNMETGPQNAKVTLIEYGDFQCPACTAYFPLTQQLHKDFNGKVNFIYRYFPITQIHPNAMITAQAAYAASLQGKFWEMHDLLYSHHDEWANLVDPTAKINSYAQSLNLDMTKFQQDMNAQSTKDFINAQEDAGTTAGVNATPTFFLNGKAIQNPAGYDAFKQVVQSALSTSK